MVLEKKMVNINLVILIKKVINIKKVKNETILNYNSYSNVDYKVNLKDNNYTTTSYVDTKIEALEVSIKEDMRGYVQEAITEVFGEELDKKIDDKIDEKIVPMSDSQIRNLF